MALTPRQQGELDRLRSITVVPSRTSVDAPWTGQADWNRYADTTANRFEKFNADEASHNRLVNIGRFASILPFGVAAGAAMAGGAGAASAAPAVSHGYSSPGIFSSLFGGGTSASAPAATAAASTGTLSRLGSILSSRGAEAGINAGLSLFGMGQQNKANAQARRDTLAAQAKEIELEERRLAQEAQNANLDREDARALNAAIQALEGKKFALAQEQAAFERGMYETEQANRAPYQQVSRQALARMQSILGLG